MRSASASSGWARPRRLAAPAGLTVELPRDPGAVALGRRRLRLLDGELPAGRLGELQLVVTELVTNALVHGAGAIRLDVQVTLGGVHGEVVDEGGGFTSDRCGRGLRIVDALATDWGVEDGRSRVWFELQAGPWRPGPPRR
jgi:hypothetical protein